MSDIIIYDPAMTEAPLAIERTPQVIAAEINTIKHQAGKILLYSFIEIGRRLQEAKSQVNHGEWGTWLKESVNFSQNKAEKLMRIATAYGSLYPASHDTGTRTQALPNLTYSKALLLLGIPEEERTDFVAELDIEGMTTQELQNAVTEKKEALQERDQAKREKELAVVAGKESSQKIEKLTQANQELTKRLAENISKLDRLTAQNHTLEQRAQSSSDSMPNTSLENQIMNSEAKYVSSRDQLLRAFETILIALRELSFKSPEVKEKHRDAAYIMMQNLTKQLEVYPPIPTFTVSR
ncbi:Protein of unknown function (DUF3102) [Desulfitobacterium dichloroeliminans LMG P-21439]|uniref:Protein export cytoplasm protein SecA ATPase RNA helicase n=1 Tax=Desulfitobacterium dichloroeliminans (strain LMG P-21439 / DCA1) TaxID=871963 RepID=L0FBI4_DESDL|nr:DUF3102 domain-containing protein [Desulfitobacterium dichloroeliminans]AGA70567.1 Protein of unknown function (DUF3102) [Desulfitobacterium dichloroeliminans LMG P-21439]